MTKPVKRILIGVIVLIVAFLIALPKINWSSANGKDNKAPTPGPSQPKPTPVRAVILKPEVLDNKVLTSGVILANEEVAISSEVAGKITQISFREGDFVAAGALLVKINDAELQAQVQKLIANKKLAETKEKRQRELLAKEAISQQEYDVAITELNVINAEIGILNAQIEKTNIRAPFAGVLGLRQVSVGAYIAPNTRIATLTSYHPAKVEFSIPSKYDALLNKKGQMKFFVEGNTQAFEGQVYAIEPKIDEATRTILMRALTPNQDKKLLPGAFVKVELSLAQIPDALLLPTQAVIPELNGQKVFKIENGLAKSVAVETGIRTDTHIQILKGLQKGDTVAITGILQLRPEAPVSIQEIVQGLK